MGVAELHACRYKWGRGCNVKVWFPECPLFGGKNTLQEHFGTKDSVRCSEFGGGRFWEVVNVLQVWDFQSVTRVLSALGSVSASRSVRSGRFYCNLPEKLVAGDLKVGNMASTISRNFSHE